MTVPPPQKPQLTEGIGAALESYVAERPSAERGLPERHGPLTGRTFGVRETAMVLVMSCVAAVALDSEGLLGWARRLEVGRVQTALLTGLVPLNGALSQLGATTPRKWAARAREALALRVGGDGDPLLAGGWIAVAPPAPLPDPLPAPVPQPLEPTPPPEVITPAEVQPEVIAAPGGGVLLLGDSIMAGSLGATLERTLASSSTTASRAGGWSTRREWRR